jgi:hypothetical protein
VYSYLLLLQSQIQQAKYIFMSCHILQWMRFKFLKPQWNKMLHIRLTSIINCSYRTTLDRKEKSKKKERNVKYDRISFGVIKEIMFLKPKFKNLRCIMVPILGNEMSWTVTHFHYRIMTSITIFLAFLEINANWNKQMHGRYSENCKMWQIL